MPGIYEQYAKYRTFELTKQEEMEIKRIKNFSLREYHGLILFAKGRAGKQLGPWMEKGIIYPDSPDITEKQPSVSWTL